MGLIVNKPNEKIDFSFSLVKYRMSAIDSELAILKQRLDALEEQKRQRKVNPLKNYNKMELVKREIIIECTALVARYYLDDRFITWLTEETDIEVRKVYQSIFQKQFGDVYKSIFKKYFEDEIDDDIESLLWISSKNLIYAMESFMKINIQRRINMYTFIESFITNQLDDFDTTYEDLMSVADDEEVSNDPRE